MEARAAATRELTGCDLTGVKVRAAGVQRPHARAHAASPPPRRAAWPRRHRRARARPQVLVVGAGGIGCELVKNLVLSGFARITMIDLDTIDYSNLNRQFLFRAHHVGRSKADVAAESAREFPHDEALEIVAVHGNVKESRFDLDYFASFAIVLNALDNVDARRHVNRLCLAAGVPLVESGTQGYIGQATDCTVMAP